MVLTNLVIIIKINHILGAFGNVYILLKYI